MKITSAELTISAARVDQFPKNPAPEIALSGRSNVGKSSFINTLLARKGLARTSQRPGKTQTLNYYWLNDRFHFVDVPGYGYAKVSKSERESWGKVMESYFQSREQLKAVVQLVDARHRPSEDDIMMYDWLKYHELPVILIGTKADKVPKNKWGSYSDRIKEDLQLAEGDPLILFSAETAQGKDKAWGAIKQALFEK